MTRKRRSLLSTADGDDNESPPDTASPGPTEEIPRLTPPGVAAYVSPAPAPVTAATPIAPPVATPVTARPAAAEPAPRPGTPADPLDVPVATAAASTPDPSDSSLFSPVIRERGDGGGGDAWFLHTGQPVPDRSQPSEPAPVARPSKAPLVMMGIVGGLAIVAVLIVIIGVGIALIF